MIKGLLEIIAQLAEQVRQQEETMAQRRDEIAVIKGEKKRPRFKPSQLDKKADQDAAAPDKGKRPVQSRPE